MIVDKRWVFQLPLESSPLMKMPKGLNFSIAEGNVFRITHDKVPNSRIDVYLDMIESSALWLPNPFIPGTFVKQVPTKYCIQLATGILNYWSETHGPEGVRGDNN